MSIDHHQVIADFSSGIPMTEIARSLNVSRQRIHQILKKKGLGRSDGGAEVRRAINRGEKDSKKHIERDQKYMDRYGCTYDEFLGIPKSAKIAYREQKGNAQYRKIGWAFTIYTWWKVWESSGKWEDRGRGDGFCMGRKNDVGIYSPDNVYICTGKQNASDYYKTDLYKSRKKVA